MQVTGSAYTQARKNSNAQKWAHLTTFERCANILGAADSPDTDLFPNCNNTGLPYEYPREAVATDSQRGPMLERPRHRVRHGRPGLWPGRTARPLSGYMARYTPRRASVSCGDNPLKGQ